MARRKIKTHSYHAYKRLSERLGLDKRETNDFARNARRLGKSSAHFQDGKLKTYLESKGKYKRVKVYRGVVVIMAKTSNRLITAYPLPNELREEYEQYDKQ